MRPLLVAIAALFLAVPAVAQQSIQQVDFKNFLYPLSGSVLGHQDLVWLDTSATTQMIALHNGLDVKKVETADGRAPAQYQGFTLKSVQFADLTGDQTDQAIVDLEYQSGGTQTTDYVYIYTLVDGHPTLLAYCHTGDRADLGLYKIQATQGKLVFALYEPAKRSGDCCSSGRVVKAFQWDGSQFAPVAPPQSQPNHQP